MGLPDKTSQPSDEFDGSLGELLEAGNDVWQFTPGGLQFHPAFCQDFFPPLLLGLTPDPSFGGRGFIIHQQVGHEAEESSFGRFGCDIMRLGTIIDD